MYLKSLVLKGFKSFADRSVLALEPGIIAVVGPNGSGKSNISDAVLWVLGERNAKHLRGQAMEDVIFAGSSARKSVGIAEVDLVLDNSDGTLPVNFDEVAVTRRMYRSGESEYLINGVVARRMDVLDILHDSGLGTGTHSIISQGSLDSILQSKPEDRRALIEEAAGVLKHKQRKAKSERKLAAMDAHLARVKDVAAEVERQLGPLERKAKRARTYQGLADELADLSLSLAVDDLRTLRRGWDEAAARERALEAELEEKRAAIAQAEAAAEELQEKIRRESVDAGELARRHRRASSAVERFDGATLLLHEKRRAAQSYEAELRVTLEANAAKRAQAEADRLWRQREEDARKARTFREQMEKAKDNARTKGEAEAKRIVRQAQAQADEIFAQLDQLRRQQQKQLSFQELNDAKAAVRHSLNQAQDALHIHDQPQEPVYTPSRPIEVGDLVELPGVKMAASVLAVNNDGTLLLQAGKMKMTVKAQQVRLPEGQPKKKPAAPASGGSAKLNLQSRAASELDIRGYETLEAESVVENYIDSAVMAKLGTVTIIHGKGTGALRKAVHEMLKRNKAVKSFRLGRYGEGEAGVTVVELK